MHLNLSKAFDTLDREILFTKLTTYEITGVELFGSKVILGKENSMLFAIINRLAGELCVTEFHKVAYKDR